MIRAHIAFTCITVAAVLSGCEQTVAVDHGTLTVERDEATGDEVSVVQLTCDTGWGPLPGADPHLGCPINLTSAPVELYDVCGGVLPAGYFLSDRPIGMTPLAVAVGQTLEEAAAVVALPMKTKFAIQSTVAGADTPITTAAACTAFVNAVKTSAFGEGPDKVFVVAYHLEAERRTQANGFPSPQEGVPMTDPTAAPAYYRFVEDVVAVEVGIRSWDVNGIGQAVKFHEQASQRDGTRLPPASGLAFAANTDVWRLQWFYWLPPRLGVPTTPTNVLVANQCAANWQSCDVDHLVLSRVATKPKDSEPNVTGEVFLKVMQNFDDASGAAMLPRPEPVGPGPQPTILPGGPYVFQRISWFREPDGNVDALLLERNISNMKGRVLVAQDVTFPGPAGGVGTGPLD